MMESLTGAQRGDIHCFSYRGKWRRMVKGREHFASVGRGTRQGNENGINVPRCARLADDFICCSHITSHLTSDHTEAKYLLPLSFSEKE